MKKLLAVVLALALALSTGACANDQDGADSNTAQDKQKVTFVLDWGANTNHAGVFVAQKLGYYEEAGLDVTIADAPEDGATALVASGGAQFGVDFQDSLAPALNQGLPVTAVAAIIQHNTSGIVSKKGNGITSPKGLEGKTYATWDMPVEQAILKSIVETDGGDFSKVNLVPSTVTDVISALESNIDAVWIYYAWDGIAAKVKGYETEYITIRDIDPVFDYYTPVIIGNNDFLSQNPETAKKFMAATAKGYEYAIENPKEAAGILLESAEGLDEDIVYESQEWLADQYKAEVEQWGYIDPQRWNAFYQWLNENNLVEKPLEVNEGFTNEYLPD